MVVVHSDGCEGRNRGYLGGDISDICQPSELIVPVPGISKYDQGVEQENIHLVCIACVQANGWQTCTRVSLHASLHGISKGVLNCDHAHPGTKPGWAWYFVKKIIFI